MYRSKKTGFITLSCQSRQVFLEEGESIPEDISADSIKRLLELGVIEKISEKGFVKETKDGSLGKPGKPGSKVADKPSRAADAPPDEPVE